MKRKINKKEYIMLESGRTLKMNKAAYDYVTQMKNRMEALENENAKLITELQCIKPIVESKDLRPAVSKNCISCKYIVRSRWNGDILGCCKDCVCYDFSPNEE